MLPQAAAIDLEFRGAFHWVVGSRATAKLSDLPKASHTCVPTSAAPDSLQGAETTATSTPYFFVRWKVGHCRHTRLPDTASLGKLED